MDNTETVILARNIEQTDSNHAQMRQLFETANEHRDYSIYTRLMDAAVEAKIASLFPYFGDVGEGDVIVDVGPGTGEVAKRAATEFPHTRVIGEDISHELLEIAEDGRTPPVELVYGNAIEQHFPDNSIKIKYFSTSGHEIESFGGSGSMQRAVASAYSELVPGGRIVIRDFAKPEFSGPVYMEILSNVGLPDNPKDTKEEEIDYSLLSTSALFDRFHAEFAGGGAFDYEIVEQDGRRFIKIDPEWAHEFYLRKDYTANWRQEIQEKYTYWNPEEARAVLEVEGYENIRIIPDPNQWILQNRLIGKIGLFVEGESGLVPIGFPPTHMIITADKPRTPEISASTKPIITTAQYRELYDTIEVDETAGQVRIGDRIFNVEVNPVVGSKKKVYRLAGQPGTVLKIVRSDSQNAHSTFRSMQQAIDREDILEEFGVSHPKILELDPAGPPYRYLIEESVPENSVCAAELIQSGGLTESDVAEIAAIINHFEQGKIWQIDSNPFGWFRVTKEDGRTEMMYASGKVYRYDEHWEFRRIGLLQWINPAYIRAGRDSSAAIPIIKDYEQLRSYWDSDEPSISLWRKYLDISVQPD